jgi:hypothetical protein
MYMDLKLYNHKFIIFPIWMKLKDIKKKHDVKIKKTVLQ